MGRTRVVTLRIFDREDSGLAFDLRDLLRLLAPRSLQATWTVAPFEEEFEATGDGALRLEELADGGDPITGRDLAALADQVWQVSWGAFVGALPAASCNPWVAIRAVDSHYYEIETSDPAVVATLKARFSDVSAVADAG